MRREFIDFEQDLPVRVAFQSIKEYPIHWHNCMEIVYVLKGSINITIETESYEAAEGEVEIINNDEAHGFYSENGDNKVLIIQLDTTFFEKYYDINNMFFYTNSSQEGSQKGKKYDTLREYLSIILCEVAQKSDDYEEVIEDILVELLYHIINNFHYLIYDEESLKENEVQFERYDRIIKYIYSNYSNKISLQDIAKKEFLSSHYLSHEIKNNVGYNFKDFLNLTRVEEAIKLLLDTDKTITEISFELGFSHTRYFNKHFKLHCNMTPIQYRKKHKLSLEEFEKKKDFISYNIQDALKELSMYLESYERYNYDDKIIKIDVDLTKDYEVLQRHNIINVGTASVLLREKQKGFLEELQEEIGFEYVTISKLLSKELNVFNDEEEEFFYWEEVREILEFINDLGLTPIIVIDNLLEDKVFVEKMLDSFFNYFYEYFGENQVKKWRFIFNKNYNSCKIEEFKNILQQHKAEVLSFKYETVKVNPIYDTTHIIPYIIYHNINSTNYVVNLTAFDDLWGRENINNEQFFGGTGLINNQGIKKPSYYAYYFLSKLGNKVINNGKGYIVTEKNGDIQILLYTYNEKIENLMELQSLYKGKNIKNTAHRKFSINIEGMNSDYKIIKYELNEKKGSSYNYWLALGRPKRLDEEEKVLLMKASFPNITLDSAKRSPICNIISKVEGYGAVLITLQKVQKHL